ncbi:unnamed protein product, partial [Staurois parvus]
MVNSVKSWMLNGGGKGNQMEKIEDVINKKKEEIKKIEKKKIIFWEISGVKGSPCSTVTSIM